MQIDNDKIDDAVLALLHLTSSEVNGVIRAWKGHDWDTLNRLYEKGLIGKNLWEFPPFSGRWSVYIRRGSS